MKVAVIILNYNSSDDCRKCILFLKQQEGVVLEALTAVATKRFGACIISPATYADIYI